MICDMWTCCTNEVEFDNFEDNSFFNYYPDFDSLNV